MLRKGDGREIDVHPVKFGRAGNGLYFMANGEEWVFPAAGFGSVGKIDGHEVRCLTADVQMLCHATGYEPADSDVDDMRRLHEELGTPLIGPYQQANG